MSPIVRKKHVAEVASALEKASIKYVFVGGVAVIAHGYVRTTYDIDIVVALTAENIENAFVALASAGYRPKQPITGPQFADSELRESWRRDKQMLVLQFWADEKPGVDVFVYEPFDFEKEYGAAALEEMGNGVVARFVSVEALLVMKREAGRHKDLADMDALLKIYE
jgi:predicted nucleotidyltransferase